MDGLLVTLDRQQVISALVVKDLLRRFMLSVQGIGQHDLARQIQLEQQLASGGNLVALGLGNDTAQEASGGVDRIDDLHSAVTDLFAVNNHDPILGGSQDLLLPPQEDRLDGLIVHPVQEAAKGGPLGTADVSRSHVAAKAKGAQLGLT